MAKLKNVQSWMNWWGWSDGGNPGSVKRDAEGNVTARHGDAQWQRDVEYACYRADKHEMDQATMDEIETAIMDEEREVKS
jgi:hypothetical protein